MTPDLRSGGVDGCRRALRFAAPGDAPQGTVLKVRDAARAGRLVGDESAAGSCRRVLERAGRPAGSDHGEERGAGLERGCDLLDDFAVDATRAGRERVVRDG